LLDFGTLEKAQEYVETKVFCYARAFERKPKAVEWKEGGANMAFEVEGGPSDCDDAATLSKSEDDSSISDDVKPCCKGKKKLNKKESQKPQKKPKEKWSKPKYQGQRRTPTPSSPSSQSSSSLSESKYLEDSSERCNRRCWNKKKGSRKQTKGKCKPHEKFTGSDPSVGDKKRIFGLSINGWEIDASAGPPNIRDKDLVELY
jgi:hypothetical protein